MSIKTFIKYYVGMLLFIDLFAMAVIGFLLRLIIPAGRLAHGEKYFLGLHRHTWVDIHLYLALLFVLLVICHIWLNWTWIVHSTKQHCRRNKKNI